MSERLPASAPTTATAAVRKKRRTAGDPERLTAVPTWIYWLMGGIVLALLAVGILVEPWLHWDELSSYHPPGMAPAVTPVRR